MLLPQLKFLLLFYQELVTLINSGINVMEAMDVLSGDSGNSRLQNIALTIKHDLLSGESLSDSLYKFPGIFPCWHADIIRYSEAAGKLGSGLQKLIDYLEKSADIQRKLIIGLAYPVILLHIAVFLFPVASLFTGGGIFAYIWQVIKVIIPLYSVFFLTYILKKFFGSVFKQWTDSFTLQIPGLGSLIRHLNLAKFIRALQCLYDSGVNVMQGWRMSVEACDNISVKRSLLKGLPVIEKGGQLREAFTASRMFSAKMLGLITAGERSGAIGSILDKIAVYFEKETEMVINTFLSVFPVIAYLGVAAYIAFKVISFYMGYFSQINSYL